ncbi:hypothetical protein D1AOALGA4SA_11672 [Olavius algarvensis Delta 1 endosymbiont]|nr:hypothetical protein D1AOALGA4SA_11672 [Olavius algarvensis Delta 1 endosymbiont]
MNFSFRNGLIWISVVIEYEGESIKFDNCILDTGSATTAIDIDLVEFNYNKPSFVKRLVGIGGGTQEVINQEGNKIAIEPAHKLKIDQNKLQNCRSNILNLVNVL